MDKLEFMEDNNIAIFVEINLLNNTMNIKVRCEEKLENYHLFYQHIVYDKKVSDYNEYLKNQLLPEIWNQGQTRCIYCKPNDHKIACLFYDFKEEYGDNYFYAKELNKKIENFYNENID